MMSDMPEEIWVSLYETVSECRPKGYWPGGRWPAVFKQNRDRATSYRLKSTVDAEREADRKTIRSLEGDLEMSNEAIRLSREWLQKVGIHATFFDDCAALAAKEITEQRETIRELAAALEILYADFKIHAGYVYSERTEKVLEDNATRIEKAQEKK